MYMYVCNQYANFDHFNLKMLKMYQGSYLTKQARSMQQFLTLPTSPSKNTEKTGV